MSKFSKGITMIELLAVIVIIGILASVLYIYVKDADYQAKLTKARAFATAVPMALPTNFISEWKFEGPTGAGSQATPADLMDTWSSSDNESTSPPIVRDGKDCVYGKCLEFDGVDDYIVSTAPTSGLLNGKANWTASFWIKPSETSGDSCFFSEGIEAGTAIFKACINANGALKLSLYDGSLKDFNISGTNVIRDKWNHFLISLKDGETTSGVLTVWLNGISVYAFNQQRANYASSNVKEFIGSGIGADYFDGLIDDIQIYNDYFAQSSSAPVGEGLPDEPSLNVTASDPNTVLITYNVPANADRVDIVRVNPANTWSETSGTTLTDSGRTPETNYCYNATSYNSIGQSSTTSNQCVTTPPEIPEIPSTLTCTATSGTQINCTWALASRAATYELQRNTSTVYSGALLTYSNALLTCATPYSFQVKACNISGCSDPKTASATTNACPINGVCGTAARTFAYSASSYSGYSQCTTGTSSNTAFPDPGLSVSWICQGSNGGSDSATCTAYHTANGICGTANTKVFTYLQTSYASTGYTQCASGTSSNTDFPAEGSSETWTCSGTYGGSASGNCTASRTGPPGVCGTAVRTFACTEASYGSYTQCASGTPSTTAFPGLGYYDIGIKGNSVTWTCSGTNGGADSGDCTAYRQASCVISGTCIPTGQSATVSGDTVWCDSVLDLWTNERGTMTWGPTGTTMSSCIGAGSSYPACYHCDNLTYGGSSNWVLPPANDSAYGSYGLRTCYFGVCTEGVGHWSSTGDGVDNAEGRTGQNASFSDPRSSAYSVRCYQKRPEE